MYTYSTQAFPKCFVLPTTGLQADADEAKSLPNIIITCRSQLPWNVIFKPNFLKDEIGCTESDTMRASVSVITKKMNRNDYVIIKHVSRPCYKHDPRQRYRCRQPWGIHNTRCNRVFFCKALRPGYNILKVGGHRLTAFK